MPQAHIERISKILTILHGGEPLEDFRARPGYRLQALTGRRKGQWSVRVTGNQRIIFRVDAMGNAYEIDLVDYP